MNRWVVATAAIFTIGVLVSGMAGCGAKLPTKSEYGKGDPQETKTVVTTEIIEDDGREILVD